MNRCANQLMNLVSHLTDRLVESNLAIALQISVCALGRESRQLAFYLQLSAIGKP